MSSDLANPRAVDMAGRNRRATAAVIGSALSTFWSGALIFGYPGIMKPVWAQRFHADDAALGWVMTFVVVSLGIFTFFAGKIHLRLGTRKSFIVGTIILVVSMLFVIYAKNLLMIYIFAFLNGTASCFVYSPSLATVQNWYPQKRGLVTGIVNLIFGLSAAIMSPIFAAMASYMSYELMGWVIIVLIVVTNAITVVITEMPDRMHLSPAQRAAHDRLLESLAASSAPGAAPAADVTPHRAVRTPAFWFIWLTWCFMGAAGISMVTLSKGYGDSLSLQGVAITGTALLTAYNLTNGFSRIVAGVLSDKIGRQLLGSISFVLAAIGYALLPHSSSPVLLCIYAAFIGFAFGTLFAITAPLGTDLFGLKYFGIIFGLIFTAYGFVGGLVGPLLSSFVLGATKSYSIVFTYLAIFSLLAAIFVIFARPGEKKEEVAEKQ